MARGCRLRGGAWRAPKSLRYDYPTLTTYHCSAVGVGGGEKPVVCQALDASLQATPTIVVVKGSGVSAPRLLSQCNRMFAHNHLLRGRIPQPMCSTSRAARLGRRPPQGRRGPTCLKGGRAGSVRRRDRWLIRPGVDPRASVASGSDHVAAPAARSRRTAVVERRCEAVPEGASRDGRLCPSPDSRCRRRRVDHRRTVADTLFIPRSIAAQRRAVALALLHSARRRCGEPTPLRR